MTSEKNILIYKKILEKTYKELKKNKKTNLIIAYIRGLLFLLIFVIAYILFGTIYFYFVIAGLIAIFIFLLVKSNSLGKKIKLSKAKIKINKNEINALDGNYSCFEAGNEFIDYEHTYSYDLDIFGQGSLFQFLNRTSTVSGKIKLANVLLNISSDSKIILNKQNAVNELSKLLSLRQHFNAIGMVYDSKKEKNNSTKDKIKKDLIEWCYEPVKFKDKKLLKIIIFVLPIITIALGIMNLLEIMPAIYFITLAIIQLIISGYYYKHISKEHSKLSEKVKTIEKIAILSKLIENETYKSNMLNKLKESLKVDNITASCSFKKLKNTIKAFDNRLNMLFVVPANMLLMWDLHIIIRLEKLKIKLKKIIPIWFNTVAEFDALSSIANFAYNNPDYVFPKINEGKDFIFDIKSGGHPLIHSRTRITNDFNIKGYQKFDIITGANMAGKSTFLRTIGINMILASTGSRVCAKKFEVKPINIFTSIRTNDSLHKNESYFYAELMRLKKIIECLKSGEKLFVILDEMLKGTNSNDKHTGSRNLLTQLIKYKASGLAATHDTELGKLKNEYKDNIDNLCFEAYIKDNKLNFDYKLKTGISKNLNATFLMKKYGIIESVL